MKLSKKINLFEDFKSEISNSGTKTNQVQVNSTKAEPTAEVKTEMLKDVDSILNNLEVLSAQIGEARESLYDFIDECHEILTEEMAKETPDQSAIDTILEAYLELFESLENEDAELHEAGGEAAKKMGKGLWRFVYWAPLARKAQQKVNKVKLNQKSLDLAADEAPNKEQRDKLKLRATRMTDKVKQLQAAVDDRFGDKGNYVKGVIQRQKIQGQLDIIKTETGMSDDPDEQATLKARAEALQKRYKEEEEALKAMEPSDEDKKKAAEELKKQQEEEAKLKAKRDAERDAAEKDAPAGDAPAGDAPAGDAPASETPASETPASETPASDKPNRPESGKNSKDDMIKRYQELLAKTEDADKKSKIQAKIDKLQAESVEMFDNAEFISILESELAEFSREIIAESFGFQTSTIADKFRKLL